MADLPDSNGDTGDDLDVRPGRGATSGTPRWVKVFGIIALLVVLLFVILLITGGPGGHGPRRHMSPGGSSGQTPPAVYTL